MQNIQIRYQPHSAQVNYLSLHDLDDPSDSAPLELPQLDLSFEQPEFLDQDSDTSSPRETPNFDSFLSGILPTEKIGLPLSIRNGIKTIVLSLFGDVLKYEHYLSSKKEIKNQRSEPNVLNYKKAILLHILVLIVALWLNKVPTIIFLIFLSQIQSNEKNQSELQKYEQLIKKVSISRIKLKSYCIINQPKIKKNLEQVNTLIKKLIHELQTLFDKKCKETENHIDDLEHLVFEINQNTQEKNFLSKMLTSSTLFQLKINYWHLKWQSHKFERVLTLFEKVILTIDQTLQQRQKAGISASKFNCSFDLSQLYNTILVGKWTSSDLYLVIPDQIKIKILSIIEKDISLKKIIRIQREIPSSDVVQKQAKQECDKAVWVQNTTLFRHQEPLYFNDGVQEEFIPEDFASIKQKLENVIKNHQQKLQKKHEEPKNDENRIDQINMAKLKLERSSFGIPIIPPAQDLSAFYLE